MALNILLIEDNQGDAFLIKEHLLEQDLSLSLDHCTTYSESIKRIRENKTDYSAILLDLHLSDAFGNTLLESMTGIASEIPTIVLTGYGDINLARKSLSYGYSDFLVKDEINSESLYKAIIFSIDRKRFNKELEKLKTNYKHLFNFTPLPVWIYSKETFRFLAVNNSAIAKYGYSESEFKSMVIQDIRPKEQIAFLNNYLSNVLRGEVSAFAGTFVHKNKKGDHLIVEIYSSDVDYDGTLARIVCVNDITEKRKMQRELQVNTFKVEKRERERIAMNLHNGLQQTILSGFMSLQNAEKHLPKNVNPKFYLQFQKGVEAIKNAIDEARNISHSIMPVGLENAGLLVAIGEMIERLKTTNLDIVLNNDSTIKSFPLNIEILLFRYVQECLNNALKHAKATQIKITLKETDFGLQLEIHDNGIGFDVAEKINSFGLHSLQTIIKSLDGEIEILSGEETKGTKIIAQVPMTSEDKLTPQL